MTEEGTPFVGRDAELRILGDERLAAFGGRGRSVWLVGEPGIGKSRLAAAVAEDARAAGAIVAWGRCAEGDDAPAYWPVVQMLSSLAETSSRPATRELTGVLDALRGRDALPKAADSSPGLARFELLQRATRALASFATARPLLLVLDDLHWADAGSLHWLEFLLREIGELPVLIVGTSRGIEESNAGDGGGLAPLLQRGRVLALSGLARSEVCELLAANLSDPPEAALVHRVFDASAGNPFFVLELAHSLAAHAAGAASPWELEGAISPGVRELLRGRLRTLPEPSRRLLEAAAVLGREFDLEPLAGPLEDATAGLLARLEPALSRGFVREVPGALRRYAFTHALMRETLYGGLAPGERSALHAAVGEALEALQPQTEERLAALAHHYYEAAQACDAEKAVRFGCRAGEHALRLLAFEEARRHFENALAASALSPDEALALRASSGLGAALHGAGERERAECVLRDAVGLGRRAGPAAFAKAVLRLAEVCEEIACLDVETNALLEEALLGLPTGPSALRARLMARLAAGLHLQPGSVERRRRLSDEATVMARHQGDPSTLGFVLARRLIGLAGPDALEERLATTDELLRDATRTRSAELEALISRADDLAERGDRIGLDHTLAAFEQRSAASGHPVFAWQLTTFRAAMALLEGRFDEAEQLATTALAQGQRVVARSAPLQFAQQLFMLRGWQARLTEVESLLEQGVAETAVVPAWRCALAYYYLLAGRETEARREYEALAGGHFESIPRDTTWLTGMALCGYLCVEFSDLERARILYDQLAPYAGRIAVASPLVVVVSTVDLRLARLASLLGRDADAERHFRDALKLAERMRALCWQAEVRYGWAVHLAPTEPARAEALFDASAAIADAVGMKLLQGWIERARAPRRQAATELAVAAGQGAARGALRGEGRIVKLAARRVAAAARPARDPGGLPPDPAPRTGGFRRQGGIWLLELEGRISHLKPMLGLSHLERLLQKPDQEVHATDLIDEARPGAPAARRGETAGDAGALLDPQARSAYQERLRDAEQELDEARRRGDLGCVERRVEEVEWLRAELSRAFGLGGRARRAGSTQERARVSVTRAIKYSIRKIEDQDPVLADHLRRSVRTGAYCRYAPSARDRVSWTF